jgi:hypothetical protein
MSSSVTLEQVEALAMQLPRDEQAKLVEHLRQRLDNSAPAAPPGKDAQAGGNQERLARAKALIAELDAIADSIGHKGEFDSAKDIRKIREERADHL